MISPQEPPSSPDISNDDHMSTDFDEQMDIEYIVKPPLPVSGQAKPWICPVCDESLTSGLALERHLQQQHPPG